MTYQEHKEAADKFIAARKAYRNMELTDEEYLNARAEWEQNQKAFDADRGE